MDDILDEESDNESEGQGKERMSTKLMDDEEEKQTRGGGQTSVGPQVSGAEESLQTSSSDTNLSQNVQRWEPFQSQFLSLDWTFSCLHTNTSSGLKLCTKMSLKISYCLCGTGVDAINHTLHKNLLGRRMLNLCPSSKCVAHFYFFISGCNQNTPFLQCGYTEARQSGLLPWKLIPNRQQAFEDFRT